MRSVELDRRSGLISLVRPETITATLTVTNQPERTLALPRRPLRDCLAEELRRLDFDEVYAEVLAKGLPLVDRSRTTPAKTAAKAAGPRKPQRRRPPSRSPRPRSLSQYTAGQGGPGQDATTSLGPEGGNHMSERQRVVERHPSVSEGRVVA